MPRPYGIVVYPEEAGEYYPAKKAADGTFPAGRFDKEEISSGIGYPSVVFFENENHRDQELIGLLEKYPNVMFCPITINSGKKTQPNPVASEFTIDYRGVLPA